jgi:hypothetical protein
LSLLRYLPVPASVHRVSVPDLIPLGDVTLVVPRLAEELLAGKEPAHQETEDLIHLVQEVHFFLGVMPVIPHELPDDRVVLLLHMSIA